MTRNFSRGRRLVLFAAAACLLSLGLGAHPLQGATAQPTCGPCVSTCATFRVRKQDDIWAISTRNIGGCCAQFTPQVWRYSKGVWQPSTLAALYTSDSKAISTSVYMHGNRNEQWESLSDGLSVYFQLIGRYDDERPVRFIIWSWPSDRIRGVRKDVQVKAARTDVEGYLLGQFLSGMRGDVQVGLLGYSFGARIITGGLHLLGGGQLCGRTISGGNRQATRVVLWAAALHSDWLLPGRQHGNALKMAERWLIYINCCDEVLQQYHRIDKCSRPVALGAVGLATGALPPTLSKRVEQLQVSHLVGEAHDMRLYLSAPTIAVRTRQYLCWHALSTNTPAARVAATKPPAKQPTAGKQLPAKHATIATQPQQPAVKPVVAAAAKKA